MAATWVLKFPQVDQPDQPILIHVTKKQGTVIDLDLLATDGDSAYTGKVRQRNLSKLQSKNFQGTGDQWTALLQYALVSKLDSDASVEHTKNLEVDCAINRHGGAPVLFVSLRSRIEDITHKLGAIELSYSENTDAVDLFGWACQLADQSDRHVTQLVSSRQEAQDANDKIAVLKQKLEDLVQAKVEHEDQLMSKFVMLLNEKKAKIRDQQRILQTAKVDKKKLSELQLVIGDKQDNKSSKRKRDAQEPKEDHDQQNESDGFEAMDLDKSPMEEDQDVENPGTPTRPDSPATATASEDEELESIQPHNKSKSEAVTTRGASAPPPPRPLPFQKKVQSSEIRSNDREHSSKPDDDEETASEDDEL